MKEIKKLNSKHLKMIEYAVANPLCTQGDIAAYVGTTQSWVSQVYNSPVFQEALKARLKEIWQDSARIAQQQMINLAKSGDFRSCAYILDSLGYKPKDEIDLTNKIIQIDIE